MFVKFVTEYENKRLIYNADSNHAEKPVIIATILVGIFTGVDANMLYITYFNYYFVAC